MSSLLQASASIEPRRHRWVVVVPIVLALVLLTLREGRSAPAALLVSPVGEHAWVGGWVWTSADADMAIVDDETLTVTHGTLLVRTRGLVTVHAGSWDVHVWNGAAHVTRQRDTVTVAAFDAPVLLTHPSGAAIVEPGAQWKTPSALPDVQTLQAEWLDATANAPVPAYFMHEQRTLLDDAADLPVPVMTGDSYVHASTAELASLVADGLPSSSLLRAVRARPLLRSFGLLHPVLRDLSWTYVEPTAVPDADTWRAILLLPRLARYGDDLPTTTVDRWEHALAAATATGSVRAALLPRLERDIRALADAGYPLRAVRLAEAVARLEDGGDLTAEAREALARLRQMTPDALRAQALSAVASDEVAVPQETPIDESLPDPAVEARARDLLVARGAMFTRTTTLRGIDAQTVDVADVVFGFPGGDRPVRFRYDTQDDTVRAIIDGALQPFAVPFETYLEWEGRR